MDVVLYMVYFIRGLVLFMMYINVNFCYNRLNGEILLNLEKIGNVSFESIDRWKFV